MKEEREAQRRGGAVGRLHEMDFWGDGKHILTWGLENGTLGQIDAIASMKCGTPAGTST
jgi:hypothetical protein